MTNMDVCLVAQRALITIRQMVHWDRGSGFLARGPDASRFFSRRLVPQANPLRCIQI